MSCGCPENQVCSYDCDNICRDIACCPRRLPIAVPVCNVKVNVICCEAENRTMFSIPDDVNGDNLCACMPCPDDGFMLTSDQKDYFKEVLYAMMTVLSPYPRCPCDAPEGAGEIISSVGHQFPIKPSQLFNEDGEALWYVSGAEGKTTTEAVDEEGNQRHPAVDECCAGAGLKHSPFINSGNNGSNIGWQGGRPHYFTDMDRGNVQMDDKIGKLVCCIIKHVDEVDEMVVVEPDTDTDTDAALQT